MTVQQEILPPIGQDIIEQVLDNPALAIRDEEKARSFLTKVREHATSIGEKDMSKSKDRDEVRSMAAKVVKSKTMLDTARKGMTEALRKEVSEINAAGKVVIEGLAEIAAEVRAPLTAWEEAEKAREAHVESTIARIKAAALVTIADTSVTVAARGNDIYETVIDKAVFLKRTEEAEEAKSATILVLQEAMHVLKQREDAQAELDAMKAAEAVRLAKEAEAAAAREAEERAARAAQEAKEREERLAQEAADNARRAAEQAAENARLEAEREAQRKIDEANARAEEGERAAQAERDRIANQEAEEARIKSEQAAEQARRERSTKHRLAVMGQIKQSLMEIGGITEEAATSIVRNMVKGRVPNVAVQF
jgi:hypothetical protein